MQQHFVPLWLPLWPFYAHGERGLDPIAGPHQDHNE